MSIIKDYHSKPSFEPRGKSIFGKDPIGHFFGVELEVEVVSEEKLEIVAEKVERSLDGFAILKKDSSLKNGFEICSSPATLSYHKENWDNFFEISGLSLVAFDSKRCGMHVHLSREPMSDLQVGKIMAFIHNPKNRDFIKHIAQRDSNNQNNFVAPRSIREAKPEHYRKFDRHHAVNLLNHSTVEIRLFQGTTDRQDFFKNLEFCHALVKFTMPSQTSISESLDFKKLLDFILKNARVYGNLIPHLVKGGYLTTKEKQPCLA